MAYTCSDIISQVSSRLKDASISNATILQFINDTNREICNRYNWDFMQDTASFSTTASVASYTLASVASDLQKLVSLRITSPDESEIWLQPLESSVFDRYIADPTSSSEGVPQYYYMWGDSIYLFSIPDGVYDTEVRYVKKPTTLESDDQPDIPEEFQEVVMLGALYRSLQTNDDFDQALVIKNQMDIQVVDMIKRLMPYPSGSPKIMQPSSPKRRFSNGSIL